MEKPAPALFKTKQHYQILDGLRGIAALAVVCFHFMEIAYSDYSQNFIGHGFLAVDFFFCLSGFVIAYAYDGRIGKIGIAEFFKLRLTRLHPLVILGSVFGLLAFLFDPFGGNPGAYSAGNLLLIFFFSVLIIPFPVMTGRYFNLFGLNAPAWSLFWEYIANIIYALVLYRLNRWYLVAIAIIAGVWICVIVRHEGNLMGGWGGSTFWDGCARVSYSFVAGILVYRFNLIFKNRLGFMGMAILLVLAFFMPFGKWNWLTEPLVVLIYFPLLIGAGAGAVLTGRFKKICVFSGNISYPLYMTHYTFLFMFGNYYRTHKPGTSQLAMIIMISMVLLVGVAFLVMVWYDIPVRRYLKSRRKYS